MKTIYAIPVSLYCSKLRILLRHKRLEWQELPPPGGYGSAEYKKLVPSGNLPALVEDDFQLADSEAIAEYLDAQFPVPPMKSANTKERAKIREFSRFHDTRLEPAVRATFAHLPPKSINDDQASHFSKSINEKLEQLGHMLEALPERNEQSLWLCDCGYPVTFAWIEHLSPLLRLSITWPESVTNYQKQISTIPAVQNEMQDYIPKLKSFLSGSGP